MNVTPDMSSQDLVTLGRRITTIETYKWCRARRDEPHRRLEVTAVMAAPVASGPAVDGVWHLDAILTWAVLWVCGRRNPYTEGDPLDIPIPLARANGVWAASCLTPWGDTRTGWVWFRKRPDLAQAETWLLPNRLPMKGGPHRAQQHPLRVSTTCLLTARAVGSPTAVAELLTVVTSVGKNRGHGYGSVREWGVRVMDGDPTPEWAWQADDGRCLRPLPIDVATGLNATGRASVGHFTPPYWRSGGVPILCP